MTTTTKLPKSVGTLSNLEKLPVGVTIDYRGKHLIFQSRKTDAGWLDLQTSLGSRIRSDEDMWATVERVCLGKPKAAVFPPKYQR